MCECETMRVCVCVSSVQKVVISLNVRPCCDFNDSPNSHALSLFSSQTHTETHTLYHLLLQLLPYIC